VCWGTLIAGNSLDTSLLDTEFASKSLCLRIQAVAEDEGLGGNGAIVRNVFAAIVFLALYVFLIRDGLDIGLFLREGTHIG